ncbi:MAG: hypothetical protein QFC55_07025 [Chloroflexota bacterium]|nr:hypothetical protein [Chloroflexota bacterium]
MSRRNRTNRRRNYGKRQHEVRERRPTGTPGEDLSRDEGWVSPEAIDDSRRHDDAFSGDGFEGWAR